MNWYEKIKEAYRPLTLEEWMAAGCPWNPNKTAWPLITWGVLGFLGGFLAGFFLV